jgi:hypothetical protein
MGLRRSRSTLDKDPVLGLEPFFAVGKAIENARMLDTDKQLFEV